MNDKSKSYPYKKILWNYNLDGASDYYRIKGKDKQYFKKYRRRQEKKELFREKLFSGGI